MKHEELQEMLSKKDAEMETKREFTIDIFNKIKDDCLGVIQKKAIDSNFDGEFWLHDFEIMGFIQTSLSLDFDGVHFDSSWVHGVDSQEICINHALMSYNLGVLEISAKYNSMALQEDDDLERSNLIEMASKYRDSYELIRKKEREAGSFIEKINYPMLCTMFRSYIISNGFYGITRKHRYTGEKCNLLQFTTNRNKFSKSACRNNDTNEKLIGASIIAVTIIFAIMLFAFS